MKLARTTDPEQDLIESIAGFDDDPLGYVLFNFPWGEAGTALANKRIRAWQRRFLDKVGKLLRAGAVSKGDVIRMARASGHGIGKSALVSMLIKWAFDTCPDTRGVVTANTELQLRTKTWAELSKWHQMSMTVHWATLSATALISNVPGHEKTWRIDAVPWSESNTEAFAGLHNEGKRLLLVFDEASAIADKVWEVAEGALTDTNTEIIWAVFGNATRANGRFRECFRKEKDLWDREQIDSRSVEGINLVEIAKLVDRYGEDSDIVKVRVRGMFPTMSEMQLISEADIDKAFGKHLDDHQYNWAPKIICVDPAWEGGDTIEIGMRQGLAFSLLATLPKNDNDVAVANLIARLEDKHRADAVFIDGGFGTGIVSAGRTMRRDWVLVWFSAESDNPGCLNKRAEMAIACRDWLKEGGAIPGDRDGMELRDELLAISTKARLDGKIQLASKKEIKKILGRSPNKADALFISFAYPVQAKPRLPDGTPIRATNADSYGASEGEPYNPMG